MRRGLTIVIGMVRQSQAGGLFGTPCGQGLASEMLTAGEFRRVITGGGVVGCTSEVMAKRIAGVCGVPLLDGEGGGLHGSSVNVSYIREIPPRGGCP